MPNPSIWGPLIGLVIVLAVVAPIVAGISLIFTRHPRTRYFWIFGALCAIAGGWWLSTLVKPARLFEEVFGEPPSADVTDMEYEVERHANQGVFVLRFRASRETVNRAIRWRVLQPRDLLPVDEIVPEALGTPDWWPPSWAPKAETYHAIGHGPQYPHIEEWLLVHPDTDETVYLMVGYERP